MLGLVPLSPEVRRARYDPAKQKIVNDRRKWKVRAWRYNISEQELLAMWDAQDQKCAICRREPSVPHVDHCHETGKVRGILCPSCNRILGLSGDDPDRLKAAADYLYFAD